jgi:broad specificity phosphatase PhoE
MTLKRLLMLAALIPFGAVVSAPAAHAATPCPTAAKLSSALGTTVTSVRDESCMFSLGLNTLRFDFEGVADVRSELASRRADASRRTRPVAKSKVRSYRAYTGVAAGVAQIFYDQKGVVVYVSHGEVGRDSASILKKVSLAVSAIELPKEVRDCAPVAKVVSPVIPKATYDPDGAGACTFRFADGTVVFVGTDPSKTFDESYRTYKTLASHSPVESLRIGAHSGFVFQTFDTQAVIGLKNSIATITVDSKVGQTPLSRSVPVRAAKVLL